MTTTADPHFGSDPYGLVDVIAYSYVEKNAQGLFGESPVKGGHWELWDRSRRNVLDCREGSLQS